MATQDNLDQDNTDYLAAFNEDEPSVSEPSEDEAFGLSPEAVVAEEKAEGMPQPEESGEPGEGSPDVAVSASSDPAEVESPNPAAVDESAADAEPAKDDASAPVDLAKEVQRLKSWEGRLKKMEADLRAGASKSGETAEQAGGEALEKAAEKAEAAGDTEMAEAVEGLAEKVESGEMSAADAAKQLAEDFGESFVKMIEVIAASKASEAGSKAAESKFGEVNKALEDVIGSISDSKARDHFEAIADAHPDFDKLPADPAFQKFIESYPDGAKIAEAGSARQIIKMLNSFKESTKQPEPAKDTPAAGTQDASIDAAEGVRSSGMRLPEKPVAAKDDYLAAWDQA